MNKVIFWDFQGTLAHNDWMVSKALYKVLMQNEPNTRITIEEFKRLRISGIPWQDFNKDYTHLTANGEWWKLVEKLFKEAYIQLSIDACKASYLARQAHIELSKPNEYHGEYYSLPGGGQQTYETLVEAVVRECIEETGYSVIPKKLYGLILSILEGI